MRHNSGTAVPKNLKGSAQNSDDRTAISSDPSSTPKDNLSPLSSRDSDRKVRHRKISSGGSRHSVKDTSETNIFRHDETGQKQVNEYVFGQTLGKGSFGKVKLCRNMETDVVYAVKILKKDKLKKRRFGQPNLFENIKREIAVMKKLDSPFVVKLFEVIDDPEENKLYLIMEYLPGGCVQDGGASVNRLPVTTTWKYFRDMLCGMDYLHSVHNIVHRDIKPENLLLDAFGSCKIADFGVCHVFEDEDEHHLEKVAGSPAFLAPEVVSEKSFKGWPVDIWALGCTLWMMLHGAPPWIDEVVYDLYEKIRTEPLVFPDDSVAHTIPELKDLLIHVLDKNPSTRLTLDDLMDHPWVTSGGSKPLPREVRGEIVLDDSEIASAFTPVDRFRSAVHKVRSLRSVTSALSSPAHTARSSPTEQNGA